MAPPPSHSQAVLPNPEILVLESICREENRFVIAVRSRQAPRCPACGDVSKSRHSEYWRTIQDLPWQGAPVLMRVRLRRFRCRNPGCCRKVFAESLRGVAGGHARRTDRLGFIVRLVGYTIGGLPGSRVLDRLAVQVSDDTVLRTVKQGVSAETDADPIRYLGVDDWAWRKGQRYGTILVDLERHRVADLLPDRSADDLRDWLQQHPTVETISRDRCGTYADGAYRGAPQALQIADRFHLVLNLSAAIERSLEGHRKDLELKQRPTSGEVDDAVDGRNTIAQQRSRERREHRVQRYEQVLVLHATGSTQKAIAAAIGISLKTVRRWLRAEQFPERKPASGRHSHVQEFEEYLAHRWNAGCHNSTQLFREIRDRGYRGGRQMVSYFVSRWRNEPHAGTRKPLERLAPKQAAALLCKRPNDRSDTEHQLFQRLTEKNPSFAYMHTLAVEFRDALQQRDGERVRQWIQHATQSAITPLVRFAWGLRRDFAAVIAAAENEWSSGQVEGQINRLKTIKRQMYGRAGFLLLRARVLPVLPSVAPSPP
jgi:transposase